jgi:hypothetical protein
MFDALQSSQGLTLRLDVVATVIEDGAILLDLDSKFFYQVNDTGWLILQLFEAGATPAQVWTACQAWGAPDGSESAIASFVDRLVGEALITPESADTAGGGGAAVDWQGTWAAPVLTKYKEPLQRVLTSAFDPTMPLAE